MSVPADSPLDDYPEGFFWSEEEQRPVYKGTADSPRTPLARDEVTVREALRMLVDMPATERNPDGEEQARDSKMLVMEEGVAALARIVGQAEQLQQERDALNEAYEAQVEYGGKLVGQARDYEKALRQTLQGIRERDGEPDWAVDDLARAALAGAGGTDNERTDADKPSFSSESDNQRLTSEPLARADCGHGIELQDKVTGETRCAECGAVTEPAGERTAGTGPTAAEHRHQADYIDRKIATIRNHRDADNCWPQWANIFADEIEDLRADLAALVALAEALRRIADEDDPLWGIGSETEFARAALAGVLAGGAGDE